MVIWYKLKPVVWNRLTLSRRRMTFSAPSPPRWRITETRRREKKMYRNHRMIKYQMMGGETGKLCVIDPFVR